MNSYQANLHRQAGSTFGQNTVPQSPSFWHRRRGDSWFLPALAAVPLSLTTGVRAQFDYTIENGMITVTGYTGPGGDVIIPDTVDGLPVTNIGDYAFRGCASLTSVTIPKGVITISGTTRSTAARGLTSAPGS